MTALWLGRFVREMALHYGFGGWILLVSIGFALLFAALGVLLAAFKIVGGTVSVVRLAGGAFVDGWRKAGRDVR